MSAKPKGRPPKPEAKRLSKMVPVRMSGAEYVKLAAKAKRAGLSISEFLRQQAKD